MNGKCRRTVLSVATRTSFMRRGLRRVCRSASLESPMFRAFFFSSRRRHTRLTCDWSSDVWSSDLLAGAVASRRKDWLGLAAVAGAAYAARPVMRAARLLQEPTQRAAAPVVVPAVMALTDGAKMAGYLSGLAERRRRARG